MISGIFFRQKNLADIKSFQERIQRENGQKTTLFHDRLLLCSGTSDPVMGLPEVRSISLADNRLVGCWMGRIHNRSSLIRKAGIEKPGQYNDGELFLNLYDRFGEEWIERITGNFSCVLYDRETESLFLARDCFGIESLYYSSTDGYLAFSSTISGVYKLTGVTRQLNSAAVGKFLLFNYNPGQNTFFADITRLPAAHFLRIKNNEITLKRYWQLSFASSETSEKEIQEKLLAHLRKAVSRQLDDSQPPGVFLSGGMDSSTVVALAAELTPQQVNTFSYRCKAISFDESKYARAMAEFTKANHHECEYSSDDILLMPEIVQAMNEPFCDVGINIATYLLGKNASNSGTKYILTGDGGDELFAGHPVYEADKLAQFLNPVPQVLLQPALRLFSALPDSDQKKNLSVKLKRFAESLAYPKELLSHRWRIYYTDKEFAALTREDFFKGQNWPSLLDDILQTNQDGNGKDLLSRCLHSDYQTAVDFYLRRNDLNRRLGIEARFPLLDRELVEFCASIPSKLKIKGWFDTKYIFKKTMEVVLPHSIIYRKDKLGHSIPLKNWIRDDSRVREMILDHVSPSIVARRGFFKEQAISKLIDDHMAKKRNNSHRLWALAVLEMWMRNFDN
ncbi:MAG: asparagine synthase (glutamine-hydrolyzing) [Desulfobulbus sp.]|nr:MAG: asparagine synthase (glutamine-hydrolyzing) [Desulfobulbus sp.]